MGTGLRRGQVGPSPPDRHGRRDGVQRTQRDLAGGVAPRQAARQDREFDAVQPKHDAIAGLRAGGHHWAVAAHLTVQAFGQLQQQGVTRVVAQGVVDVLEAVEVQVHQRQLPAGGVGMVHAFRSRVLNSERYGFAARYAQPPRLPLHLTHGL
jgi:hypothetical protein